MNWVILIGLVIVLFVQIVILGWVVRLTDTVILLLEKITDAGCNECGAKWQKGAHGKFVQHAEWCKKNPRWKGGATA